MKVSLQQDDSTSKVQVVQLLVELDTCSKLLVVRLSTSIELSMKYSEMNLHARDGERAKGMGSSFRPVCHCGASLSVST